ncbi:MAG: DUF502 domain-containing protein [Hyphomicrobiaceae bacterium]|nr:DUF502 domain-containing protein [Hyphomicrobiaceae bacterium]
MDNPDGQRPAPQGGSGLANLTRPPKRGRWHIGARLRNYFLTGLVVVGPVGLTILFIWFVIDRVDTWVKPLLHRLLPAGWLPVDALPFNIPGIGLITSIIGLMIIGALAANLLGRTLISFGELFVGRMPIVRNVYSALKQLFESVLATANTSEAFQKVGLIEFPSKGVWSLVFVTAEVAKEIQEVTPSSQDLVTVFVPTGIVPPTGFVSFVPRDQVKLLSMTVEDAAKIILSGGMVVPDAEKAAKGRSEPGNGWRVRQLTARGGQPPA